VDEQKHESTPEAAKEKACWRCDRQGGQAATSKQEKLGNDAGS